MRVIVAIACLLAATCADAGTGNADGLVRHFYQSILHRQADDAGAAHWTSEGSRLVQRGATANEAWFAIATAFFDSPEYRSLDRDAPGYVTDLYRTFFDREPDAGGLAYWSDQLASGATREGILATFMFSPEFAVFASSTLEEVESRAEVDVVMDFYRGVLGRLPENEGLGYWAFQLQNAQCGMHPEEVKRQADLLSAAFLSSAEYGSRDRGNAQYVDDLYNAFMRRSADAASATAWRGLLDAGATRESVRRQFLQSPEFEARVQAVIDQGCGTAWPF